MKSQELQQVKGDPATLTVSQSCFIFTFKSQQMTLSCQKYLYWFSLNSSGCLCASSSRPLPQFFLCLTVCVWHHPSVEGWICGQLCSAYRKLPQPLTRSDGRLGVSQWHHFMRRGRAVALMHEAENKWHVFNHLLSTRRWWKFHSSFIHSLSSFFSIYSRISSTRHSFRCGSCCFLFISGCFLAWFKWDTIKIWEAFDSLSHCCFDAQQQWYPAWSWCVFEVSLFNSVLFPPMKLNVYTNNKMKNATWSSK